MRRFIYALTVSALAATGAASVATAKQVVPMHTQDEAKTVTEPFRAIAISVDEGDITLRPGRTTIVHAHEEWNLRQPTFAVSISKGVLHVSLTCNGDVSVGNTVTVVGALDQANDCINALTISAPAGVPVEAETGSGNITAAKFHGGLKLVSGSGDVTVRDASGPQLDAGSSNGKVMGTNLHADSVSLASDSGDVVANTVHAHSLTLKSSNGAVTANEITSTVLTSTSDSGDVALTDASVTAQAAVHSSNGAVRASQVHAGSLEASSDAGNVTIDTITGGAIRVNATNGTITANRISGSTLSATDASYDVNITDASLSSVQVSSGNAAITARNLHARTASLHSDAGNVTAQLANKPEMLTATSGNGDVDLDVPAGRYDIQADTDNGVVHVTGLIIDTSVRPFIRAHCDSGNVTVTGH